MWRSCYAFLVKARGWYNRKVIFVEPQKVIGGERLACSISNECSLGGRDVGWGTARGAAELGLRSAGQRASRGTLNPFIWPRSRLVAVKLSPSPSGFRKVRGQGRVFCKQWVILGFLAWNLENCVCWLLVLIDCHVTLPARGETHVCYNFEWIKLYILKGKRWFLVALKSARGKTQRPE